MAANPINVVTRLHAVQYDGTNSSDIAALFALNNSSESGGTWNFQSPPDSSSFTIHTGDWILFAQNQAFSKTLENEFDTLYSCNTLCDDVGVFATGQQVRSIGVAPVPSLVLSGTANVDVTLYPAMPDTSYAAHAATFAGVSLANLQINSVTVVDEDTVRVAVQNTGLLTLAGASLIVHAVA
jgi:hypothetical protein